MTGCLDDSMLEGKRTGAGIGRWWRVLWFAQCCGFVFRHDYGEVLFLFGPRVVTEWPFLE